VANAVIRDNCVQLFTEQSKLYHAPNAQQWMVSSKTLKWFTITPEEMGKFLGHYFDGSDQKGQYKRLLVN
jgi:hypothetical protein